MRRLSLIQRTIVDSLELERYYCYLPLAVTASKPLLQSVFAFRFTISRVVSVNNSFTAGVLAKIHARIVPILPNTWLRIKRSSGSLLPSFVGENSRAISLNDTLPDALYIATNCISIFIAFATLFCFYF